MNPKPHILVVDDEPDIRELLKEILEDEGYSVAVARDADSARQALTQHPPELVFLDIWMPGTDGISLLKEWQAHPETRVPVVMMSGHGTVETAVEATRLGAFDYIEKPLSLGKLLITARNALRQRQAGEPAAATLTVTGDAPTGRSPIMQAFRRQIESVAREPELCVYFHGEHGSGKRFWARYLHQQSSPAGRFFPINALWLQNADVYSSLFGNYDNRTAQAGVIERTTGGTLLIEDAHRLHDETLELLVTAFETGSYRPRGSDQIMQLQTRLLLSSDSGEDEGRSNSPWWQQQLLRLSTIHLTVPPLREHNEDIPELLDYFVNKLGQAEGLPYRYFPVASQNRLRYHSWPGNSQELQHVVRKLLLSGQDEEISLNEVEALLESQPSVPTTSSLRRFFQMPLRQAREQFEKSYLEYHLNQAMGNVGKVANATGLERTHLYRKIRALGIDLRQTKSKT